MLLRTCLNNIKSVLNPRPKCHIRFRTQGRPRKIIIHFLNPKDIGFDEQTTVDISGKVNASYTFPFNERFQTVVLKYYHKEKMYFPYPTNTRGRLYYCAPSQDRPRLSGSFRFRVLPFTSDRPEGFAKGTDLLRPDGRPWELSLYSAIHSQGCAPLVRKLLNEELLETDLLDTIAGLPRISLTHSSGVLYTLSDPFTLSLGQDKFMTIITEKILVAFRFRPLLDPSLGQHPFTGTVLARFEKSNLPEHMNKRVVLVRVLEVLSPIECVIPDYNFDVQLPAAGQLITKNRRLFGDYHPWSINISERSTSAAKCLGLLFPESTLSSSPLKCERIR